MDPEKLLIRVHSGKPLKEKELEDIAALLGWSKCAKKLQKVNVDERYSLLVLLGHARAVEYRALLESYLEVSDPITVAKTLEILCLEWHGTADYLERVIRFALGVSTDYDEDVRQMALKILGEYLRQILPELAVTVKQEQPQKHRSSGGAGKRILELLIRTFEDTKNSPWIRQHAYYALCRAVGREWEQIPSECKALDLGGESTDIDADVLNQCNSLLSTLSSSLTGSSEGELVDLSPGIR